MFYRIKILTKRSTELVKKSDELSVQSERFIEETFEGSLPAFLAAFTARKGLTPEEFKDATKFEVSFHHY